MRPGHALAIADGGGETVELAGEDAGLADAEIATDFERGLALAQCLDAVVVDALGAATVEVQCGDRAGLKIEAGTEVVRNQVDAQPVAGEQEVEARDPAEGDRDRREAVVVGTLIVRQDRAAHPEHGIVAAVIVVVDGGGITVLGQCRGGTEGTKGKHQRGRGGAEDRNQGQVPLWNVAGA